MSLELKGGWWRQKTTTRKQPVFTPGSAAGAEIWQVCFECDGQNNRPITFETFFMGCLPGRCEIYPIHMWTVPSGACSEENKLASKTPLIQWAAFGSNDLLNDIYNSKSSASCTLTSCSRVWEWGVRHSLASYRHVSNNRSLYGALDLPSLAQASEDRN